MAGPGAVADLVQSCLLGSNCVLTWRETKYYSHAGKQIIVTSLASRWLYLSLVQMEFEEKKLADDAAWAGCTCVCSLCVCIWLFTSLFVCLSTCLPTCLSPQHLPVCFLIYQPVCFCIVADVSTLQVFISESAAVEKKMFKWIRASVHSP